jgi:hypothetical protein
MPMSERLQQLNAATAIPRERLRGSVPQSLHPDQLLDCAEACVDTDGASASINGYSAGRSAMKLMVESLTDIEDVVEAAKITRPVPNQVVHQGGKPILERIVDPAHAANVRGAMATSAERVAKGVERHLKALESSLSNVEQAVEGKLRDPRADGTVSQDIRRFVFSLPHNERRHWVEQRIAEGDLTVAHAVLQASPYASGLDAKGADLLREHARQRFAPAETRMRDGLRTAQKKVTTAMQTYSSEYARRLPLVPDNRLSGALKNLQRGAA